MDLKLGSVEITSAKQQSRRISMVLWGQSGCGKTTLAATAPSPILIVNFDPDGPSSLGDREDVLIADFSDLNPNSVQKFCNDNPAGLKQFVEMRTDIKTVIFDSVTAFGDMALRHAVSSVRGATIEAPTLQGYGMRNSIVQQAVFNMIKLTSQLDKHLIFICHEAPPEKDEMTGMMTIGIMLGGKLPSEVPVRFSEVWHMEDTGKERKIYLRSSKVRKPMKTRMFECNDRSDFPWRFDAGTSKGEGIKDWYQRWVENGGKKIAIPS